MSESKLDIQPEGYKGKDICFTMSELNHSYRKHLGSSLAVSAMFFTVVYYYQQIPFVYF